MNIRQFETLVAIVDHGGFAAAADALATTQSAVSARIKELERQLGVPLFDRSRLRARLTAKGEELLPLARQFMRLAGDVARRVGDPGAFGGIIRIGVAGLVAQTVLPGLLIEMRLRFPRLAVRVHVNLAGALATLLQDGALDLALTTAPVTGAELAVRSIGHQRFAWMAGPALRTPDAVLRPGDVARLPVLGFPPESYHFPVIDRWFHENGGTFTPVISCNSMEVLARLTASGVGVAVLPEHCYADLVAQGALRVLRTEPAIPPVAFAAAYRLDRPPHPLAELVSALAAELSGADAAPA
jgi:DNA-binding transcriptional LysR family regulator